MAGAKYNDYTRMRYEYYNGTDDKRKDDHKHADDGYREQSKATRMRMHNPEENIDPAQVDALESMENPVYEFDDGPFHYNGHADLFDETEFRYNHSDLFDRGGAHYSHSDLFDK